MRNKLRPYSPLSRQVSIFIVGSGIAAGIHWLTRIWLSTFFDFLTAIVVAYFAGMVVAFTFNYLWVFPNSTLRISTQITRFFMVNLATMPAVWITALVLVEIFKFIDSTMIRESIAHGIAVALPAISSFIAYKFFAFKR